MKQLDSVTGAIVENVDNTIRRIEVIAAYQLGQAKNTLTHVYWSATNPKNICFVEYKHKVFRAKVVKLEAHTKAAKVGCLPRYDGGGTHENATFKLQITNNPYMLPDI